jgi:flagellar hook-associated protein 3 FlgL
MSTSPIAGFATRIPDLLRSQSSLAQITRTQLSLFQVNAQLSSGRAITRFSDDSATAAAIAILDDRLERAGQYQRNLDHADASLTILDKALGDASELILEAKSIASEQVGLGSTPAERAAQAQVVDSLIQNLFGISNRTSVAGHVFAGSTPGTPAIEAFLGGYRYRGQGSGLLTDLGLGTNIPVTIGGGNAIGQTSTRIQGDVDLDPALTSQTRVVDLNGALGQGVRLGRIEFSFDGGPRTAIDLTGADSAGEIATRIQTAIQDYEQANSATILGPGGVSLSGGSLSIDVAAAATPPNPSLQFFDISTGTTAQDLGLAGNPPINFASGSANGLDLQTRLTWQTPVSALRGITPPLGSIRVNNMGQSRVVNLSSAQTIEDLKNLIQGAGVGLRVELNADRTGIDIVNETAAGRAQAMSIEEVAGSNFTATRLGIRSYAPATRLSDFNDGRGIEIVDKGVDPVTGLPDPARDVDFRITLGDGFTFDVDLRPQDIVSVQTLIDRINASAAGAGLTVPADFSAGLSDGVNGLTLTQGGSITGAITIQEANGSRAAEQLGLMNGTFDSSTGSFRAADRAKVRVDNLFTTLIDLRDSLLANDTIGITLAGEKLEESVDRLAQTRALVGGYAKRVTDGSRQLQDSALLDESTRSTLRDTDFAEAAVRLNMLTTQLQAGLQVTASSYGRSLLDFLG